jgi:hypothetical protein
MDQYARAIRDLEEDTSKTITGVAKEYGLQRSTLSRRFRGVTESASQKAQSQQLLSPPQEQRLIKHIKQLSSRGLHPTPAILRNLALEISGKEPGKNWSHRFVQRHSNVLGGGYCERLNRQRFKADYKAAYNDYFDLLKEKVEKHNIQPQNTYNMDEKGFLIGWSSKQYRIFSKASKLTKTLLADGNREFITLLACICADGTPLPPGIIFAGASGQLQDTWVKDVTSSTNAFFAATPNGWTNDDHALKWMERVFDPITKPKARRDKRLLVLDGHGSHINMKFLNWCESHSIIVACYPPHTTHRLQPLDVSLFAPLALRYSQQVDQFQHQSRGLSKVSKRDFFSFFEPAFEQSFIAANIHSAFAKTGLYPLNSSVVVSDLPSAASSRPSTSTSSNNANPVKKEKKQVRFIDQLSRKVKKEPDSLQEEMELHLLRNYVSDLAAENRLQKNVIAGLEKAIYIEQGRRKKGKTLIEEHRAKEGSGSLWFSPSGLQRARDLNESREAAKHAAKEAKQIAAEAKAIKRQQEAILKQQQALERADTRQKKAIKLETRKTLQQRLKEVQQANKQLLGDIQTTVKTPRKAQKNKQPPVMAISSPVPPKLAEELDPFTTRSGRQSTPSRRRRAP